MNVAADSSAVRGEEDTWCRLGVRKNVIVKRGGQNTKHTYSMKHPPLLLLHALESTNNLYRQQ